MSVASSKNIKTRVQKPEPTGDQIGQNRYCFRPTTPKKPFGTTHPYIGRTPPPPSKSKCKHNIFSIKPEVVFIKETSNGREYATAKGKNKDLKKKQ